MEKVIIEFLCNRSAWNLANLQDKKQACLMRFQAEYPEINWTIERIPEYCEIEEINSETIMIRVETANPSQNFKIVYFQYHIDEWRIESLYNKKYICLMAFEDAYPDFEWTMECMPNHWLISRIEDDLIEIRVKAVPYRNRDT